MSESARIVVSLTFSLVTSGCVLSAVKTSKLLLVVATEFDMVGVEPGFGLVYWRV